MSDAPRSPGLTLTAPRRSLGLKLLLVCGLAFLMSIPALFVFALLSDRTHRADTVAREVGDLMGGPQTFLGPVIAVPYARVTDIEPGATTPGPRRSTTETGVWFVFPDRGQVTVTTDSEVRRRSLFEVPVYEATIAFSGDFSLADAGATAPVGSVLDWSRAEVIMGVSDPRGARSDLTVRIRPGTEGVAPLSLAPSSLLARTELAHGEAVATRSDGSTGLSLFGARLGDLDRSTPTAIQASATFSGAQRLAILPFAGTTQAVVRGDWPHPSYNGGFLPHRQGSGETSAFEAEWSVPFVARGVPMEGGTDTLTRLGPAALGVSFIEPANPYQSVSRSLKYAPMFIGLVFLAFFVFETTTGRRVHPAQYILVGLAQVIFYMLLLSIAEHLGFDPAFLVAAVATVGLISAYAGWTFESRAQGVRALVTFGLLYGLIYVLMRLEDYALLVGALASFGAIAAVMYSTRKLDWYGVTARADEGKI